MKRKVMAVTFVAAGSLGLFGGMANAAVPGPGGVFHGCVQQAIGQLRVIDPLRPPPAGACADPTRDHTRVNEARATSAVAHRIRRT